MAIRINAVKSSRLSDDRREVIVLGAGKYTGDLELRFASQCVDDLINALTDAREAVLSAPASTSTASAARPVAAPTNMEVHVRADAAANNNPDQVKFEIPRNGIVTADTSGRGLVLLILNHKLDRQVGYAFSPDAAKQMADGFSKSADALLSLKARVAQN